MSKTAAIKHTKLYTFHPQKFQTFKIRTLPTPQPNKPYLSFSSLGGVKNPRCFLFCFGSSKNKTLFQGYVGVFFDEEGITKRLQMCLYNLYPFMHRSKWFPGIFWYPPQLHFSLFTSEKNNPTRCSAISFGADFFFGKPRLFWDSAFLLLVLQRIPWSV